MGARWPERGRSQRRRGPAPPGRRRGAAPKRLRGGGAVPRCRPLCRLRRSPSRTPQRPRSACAAAGEEPWSMGGGRRRSFAAPAACAYCGEERRGGTNRRCPALCPPTADSRRLRRQRRRRAPPTGPPAAAPPQQAKKSPRTGVLVFFLLPTDRCRLVAATFFLGWRAPPSRREGDKRVDGIAAQKVYTAERGPRISTARTISGHRRYFRRRYFRRGTPQTDRHTEAIRGRSASTERRCGRVAVLARPGFRFRPRSPVVAVSRVASK